MNKETSDSFDQFWKAYPRKELKYKAKKIWLTYDCEPDLPEILAFIEKAKKTKRWKNGFIRQPHYFLENGTWYENLCNYNLP